MRAFRRLRAAWYDAAVVGLTAPWYAAVLCRLPRGCRLLDVGIGTGAALLANVEEIESRDVRITGVDVDADYVERCRCAVAQRRLENRIDVRLESVDAHRGGPYDAVYFSGSFMLLPDPPGTLRRVSEWLAPGGRFYFTQTFERRRSRGLEILKPLLRFVTTIDFGRVTYEADFRGALEAGGVAVEALETLHGTRRRAAVLVVARPQAHV